MNSDRSNFAQLIEKLGKSENFGRERRLPNFDGRFWLDDKAEIGLTRFMELYPSSSDIPKKARVRGPWIVFRLRVAGSSLTAIAAELEVTKAAVSDAIVSGSSERLERAVAEKLHLPVQNLFPERYDAAGCRQRPKRKRTTPPSARNGKGQEAVQT
ncbi:helix-turn-helix domain-containing protein [Azospirillum argentinense]|uniref:Helix-turn-helix domain-containing protein n=1 Tax=Azospirillum argentinense TaxID=2970906 RepID=A0ABW8VE34_9PROT